MPAAAKTADLSLIICTRNRCGQLVRCFETILRLKFERPWELIIVDNGSTDATAAAIQEFVKAAPFPIFYVSQPKLGLGSARNAGLVAASGEILAFTDDDCYPAPDFLSRVCSAFEDRSLGYVTGRILLHDSADLPIGTNASTEPVTFRRKSFINPGGVQGANMAFRREVLNEIGGFDPLLALAPYFLPKIWTPRAGPAQQVGTGNTAPTWLFIIITDGGHPIQRACGNPTGLALVRAI